MKQIRILVLLLQLGLLIAGLTAFWIPQGVSFLTHDTQLGSLIHQQEWLETVDTGVQTIDRSYPFIWYGTDWMVFAHILFAILFYGLYKDPIKNQWLVHFGIIACLLIVPLALIMGPIRGIPFIWQLLDCSFGLIAGIILLLLNQRINKLTTN